MKEFKKGNNLFQAYMYCTVSYVIALFMSVVVGITFNFLHPLLMILLAGLTGTDTQDTQIIFEKLFFGGDGFQEPQI